MLLCPTGLRSGGAQDTLLVVGSDQLFAIWGVKSNQVKSGPGFPFWSDKMLTIGVEHFVLSIYNDNTGVLVEVVFVELVQCSGGSARPFESSYVLQQHTIVVSAPWT